MLPFIRNNYTPDRKGWKNEYTLSKADFSGGMNNVKPENLIEDNECVDSKNMRIVSKSILEKRPGVDNFTGLKLDDETPAYPRIVDGDDNGVPITFMDTFAGVYENYVVRATDSNIFFDSVEPWGFPEDFTCEVAGRVSGVSYGDKYFFVDGECLRVFNSRTRHIYKVIEEPVSHIVGYNRPSTGITEIDYVILEEFPEYVYVGDPILILGSSFGSDTNFTTTIRSVEYVDPQDPDNSPKKYNFTDALEVNIAPEDVDILIDKPIFFYLPLSDKFTQGEELWMQDSLTGEYHVQYRPCINELGDSMAGESYIPSKPKIIVAHENRLFISGDEDQPNLFSASRSNQPLYFPVATSFILDNHREEINNMFTFDGALVIGDKNNIYALYGYSEYVEGDGLFRLVKMDVSVGFMCENCGAILQNYYIFLGSDGRFYLLTTPTTNVEYLMTKTLGFKIDLFKNPFNFIRPSFLYEESSIIEVSAVAHRNEVFFALQQGDKNVVIVYNYDCMAFTYFVGWDAYCLMEYGDRLFIGNGDGYLARYFDDYAMFTDYGDVPIECNFTTKLYQPYGNLVFKFFKQMLITTYIFEDVESNIECEVTVDYITHKVASHDNPQVARYDESRYDENLYELYNAEYIRSSRSIYDDAIYDIDFYNSSGMYKSIYYQLNMRGRTIQFKFYNSGLNEGMRIYDVNTVYTMRDIR